MPQNLEEGAASTDSGLGLSEASAPDGGDSPSPEGLRQARAAYRSYYRWLRASRLMMAACLALAGLFLLWILPLLPSGFDTADYSSVVAFTIYLLVAFSIVAVMALVVRERAWRKRQSLMVWSAVYDEETGLHNRTYLWDRLSLECDRAERMGGVFSLLVLYIRLGEAGRGPSTIDSNAALHRVAESISRISRPTDLTALLSRSELAVLTMGVDREKRAALLERICATAAAELSGSLDGPAGVDVIGGAATYAVEGKEAADLIRAARAAATLALPRRGAASPPSAKEAA